MSKKVIIWNYQYEDMKETWKSQMQWLIKALQGEGYQVLIHPEFKCEGLINVGIYDWNKDKDAEIVIYNHTDVSVLIGNIYKAKQNWFFKPTVPDEIHTTLDKLGYGAYSSITYKKPPFEQCKFKETKNFFDTKVKGWIGSKITKWGNIFENESVETLEKDYYLVLGQCGGDYVVTQQDFGYYFTKLEQIVKELIRITDKIIVVKLHPYTDGKLAKDDKLSTSIAEKLRSIDERVKVYLGKINVHSFIENARCVILANSGAGFEVMMHHKPIIAWGYPEYHWIAYDLRHLCDLHRALKLDWFNPNKSDQFLYWYMEKYCYYDQESAQRRVREILKEK